VIGNDKTSPLIHTDNTDENAENAKIGDGWFEEG
jgi:hypothetical protein